MKTLKRIYRYLFPETPTPYYARKMMFGRASAERIREINR